LKIDKIFITLFITLNLSAEPLRTIIQEVISKNEEIHSLIQASKATQKEVEIVYAQYLPKLKLSTEVGREHTATFGNQGKNKYLTTKYASLEGSLNLFSGFETTYKIKEKKLLFELSKFTLKDKMISIAYSISLIHLDILKAYNILQVIRKNTKIHKETLDKVILRLENGVGYESDMYQAQSRLDFSKISEIMANKNLKNLTIQYRRLTGKSLNLSKMKYPKIDEKILDKEDLYAQVKIANPKIQIAKLKVKISKVIHKQTKSKYYPLVDLVATKNWSTNIHGLEEDDNSEKLLLRMSYNLYNGYSDKNKDLKMQYESISKEHQKQMKLKDFKEKLSLAYSNFIFFNKQLKLMKLQLNNIHKTHTLYKKEYEYDKRSVLELLNVEQEYNQTYINKVQVKINRLKAYFEILEISGYLLKYFQIGEKIL